MNESAYPYKTKAATDPVELYGKQIWTSIFEASVPMKDSMSSTYKRLFGMPTVGDDIIDREMHIQPFITYITINKMVEYFEQGITVRILKHSDTKIIYEIVDGYLNGWANRLRDGINVGGAPIDDLVTLDKFASVVYPHAQQHVRPDQWTSRFASFMSGGGIYSSRESLSRDRTEPVQTEESQEHVRESFASIFTEGVVRGQGRSIPSPKETRSSRWSRNS